MAMLNITCLNIFSYTPAQFEEVRGELHSVQRELQGVRDEAKAAVTSRERLSQELQTKQAQLCCLEGQLDAARSLGNKLTQEVKRSESAFLEVCFATFTLRLDTICSYMNL